MLQKVLLVWVLAWTVIAFALMGIDKAKAKRHKPVSYTHLTLPTN